jgi:hypothetical protein
MDTALWNNLFSSAEKILAAAPWEEWPEDLIFAIQPRADGAVYFVSAMGMIGQHRSIAFYKGGGGISAFRRVREELPNERLRIEALLLAEQFQIAFETRKNVLPADMAVLKACGKRYRGKWPVFHSHRPARMPWTASEEEARELEILARRSLEVYERIARGEELLSHLDEEEFFLIDSEGKDSVCRPDELPAPRHILQFGLPKDDLDSLKRVDLEVEVEMALLVAPIKHPVEGEPPYLPFFVAMLDANYGMAMGFEMLDTSEGLDSAFIRLPETITEMLKQVGVIPRAIRARHPSLLPFLDAYCQTYEIELIPVEKFDHADFFIEMMKKSRF